MNVDDLQLARVVVVGLGGIATYLEPWLRRFPLLMHRRDLGFTFADPDVLEKHNLIRQGGMDNIGSPKAYSYCPEMELTVPDAEIVRRVDRIQNVAETESEVLFPRTGGTLWVVMPDNNECRAACVQIIEKSSMQPALVCLAGCEANWGDASGGLWDGSQWLYNPLRWHPELLRSAPNPAGPGCNLQTAYANAETALCIIRYLEGCLRSADLPPGDRLEVLQNYRSGVLRSNWEYVWRRGQDGVTVIPAPRVMSIDGSPDAQVAGNQLGGSK